MLGYFWNIIIINYYLSPKCENQSSQGKRQTSDDLNRRYQIIDWADDRIVRLANKRDECSTMQPNFGEKVDRINLTDESGSDKPD